ncbi:MAG: acyl carrier protein [Alphaproteobacteria bacterium]|nr:acyl carrier protein [Alphaproteobacteria bacterium]
MKIELLNGYDYPTKPESVFYNVKQILLVKNHDKAINLSPNMSMVADLGLSGTKLIALVAELEKRYGVTIKSHSEIANAKTLQEFCAICAKDINPIFLQNKIEWGRNVSIKTKKIISDMIERTKE